MLVNLGGRVSDWILWLNCAVCPRKLWGQRVNSFAVVVVEL